MTMSMTRRAAICEWDLMMASTHRANHSIPHHLILTVWMEPIGKYHYVVVVVAVVPVVPVPVPDPVVPVV